MVSLETMLNLHTDFDVFESPCDVAALRFAVRPPPISPITRSMRNGNETVHNACRGCPRFRADCPGMWDDTDVCPLLTELN